MNVPRTQTKAIYFTAAFAILILVPSLIGFAMKFREFLALWNDEDGAFTVVPVVNYLLATAGFFLLLCWATLHGMFRNIERPKYDMLRQEQELEEDEKMKQLIGH
jgi:hypothetical protein